MSVEEVALATDLNDMATLPCHIDSPKKGLAHNQLKHNKLPPRKNYDNFFGVIG